MSIFALYNVIGYAIGVGVLIGYKLRKERQNKITYEEHTLEDNGNVKRIEIVFGK